MSKRIPLLSDWIYHAIEESITCQFTSVTARGIPVALPVILNHFDPDTGTLVISSPVAMKRVANIRRQPAVAMLFSPVGASVHEPPHVVLAQGRAEVDDTDPANGWRRYFAGWARRHPPARAGLAQMSQAMPGYTRRAVIRVRPDRLLGWEDGDLGRAPSLVEMRPGAALQDVTDGADLASATEGPAEEPAAVAWTDDLRARVAPFSRAALSYLGRDGYPVTLPLPFTFDPAAGDFTLPMLAQPPARAGAEAREVTLTLLRFDAQAANERYLLLYGRLAARGADWVFTPTRVVLSWATQRGIARKW